jgi:hypothetical protein
MAGRFTSVRAGELAKKYTGKSEFVAKLHVAKLFSQERSNRITLTDVRHIKIF